MSVPRSTERTAKGKLIAVLIWLALLGLGAGGYVWWFKPAWVKNLLNSTSSESSYKHNVRLRVDSFSGYCILRSPELKGSLKKEGIKLEIVDDKADYLDRIQAIREGKADMAVFTIDSLLSSCAKIGDFPATIVMVIDETKGADAIIAYKQGLANIQDLNNSSAKIVLTPNSPSEFMARVVIADFNLPNLPDNWMVEADGAAGVYAKFQKGLKSEKKAYALWEPYVSKALKNPDAHVLLSSDKLKGYVVDVLVARREFLQEKPELVKAVVENYLRAAYHYNQQGMLDLVVEDSKETGDALTREDAERLVKGIQWKNTLENYAHFRLLSSQEASGLEDLEEIIPKIKRILLMGAVKPDSLNVEANTLFYDKIMRELQESKFHPARKLGIVQDVKAMDMDKVRGDQELPELTEKEWESLISVGQMRIKSLEFQRGTSDLTIQGKRDLEELASKLKSMPQYYLVVAGHARAQGDPEANLQLAKERAQMASEYLVIRLGISRNRVKAIAARVSDDSADAQSVSFQLGQKPY